MILTAEQLLPFLYGAVETEIRDGALIPYKFGAKTLENWRKLAVGLYNFACQTSGIRLDFTTYTDRVSFCVEGGVFEVLVDGISVCLKDLTHQRGEIEVDLPDKGEPDRDGLHLPGKMTRVTLIFPNLSQGRIYSATVPDDAVLRRPVYDEKFLFLGDSITQGYYGTRPGSSFAWSVSRFFNADMIVQGVAAASFRPEVFEAPEGFDPDRVFVAFGANDFGWGHPPERVRAFAAGYLDKVKAAYGHKKVYCILPIWRDDGRYHENEANYAQCVAAIREEEEARGFTVIDGMELVPHAPDFYNEDLLHPNDLGFSFYAQNLIRRIL